MVRTHPNTVSMVHHSPAHGTRPVCLARVSGNTARSTRISVPARAVAMVGAGAMSLAALPVLGRPAWGAMATVSAGDACTAMLLQMVLVFAIVAGAVTALGGLACGLANLLDTDR